LENDSIRASGNKTLVDVWIEGKLRAIVVTREAIETFLGSKLPESMSDDDRCEFVRMHLPQVVAAAQVQLRGNAGAGTIVIEAGQLGPARDRRSGERRKSERRKSATAAPPPPHGERRRGQRRNGDRRRSGK
jgi:hypothetical protein